MGAMLRSIVAEPEHLEEFAGVGADEATPRAKPRVGGDLHRAFSEGRRLVDVVWEQQRAHEAHRWSIVEAVEAVNPAQLTESDRMLVWNAGRAELTAKPSADRMARLADRECRRFQGKNDVAAAIIQALGTWTRYWNEEEARHETGFNQLSQMLGFEPVSDELFIEYRKIFPEDDLLRTVTMLAFSESIAAVNYGQCARGIRDPGLNTLFKKVGADEVRHMNYFISFARGLVETGEYALKESFAVANFFLREGGELYGARREHVEHRDTHINWWDHLEYRTGMNAPDAIERKRTLILYALRRITGIACSSVEEVEDQYLELVGC
ncbi:ferritin-like domain-containing protein [Myxococcaceae bacterium GXIMD 01537]